MLTLPFVLCGFAAAQPAAQQRPEFMTLPLTIDGTVYQVVTHVYKPQDAGSFPLVIFSHNRAPLQVDRDKLQVLVLVGHANYWLRKGVAVVAPVRPGYSETGGADRENSLTRWSGSTCTSDPDFTQVGRNSSAVVAAVHELGCSATLGTHRPYLAGGPVGRRLDCHCGLHVESAGCAGQRQFCGCCGSIFFRCQK